MPGSNFLLTDVWLVPMDGPSEAPLGHVRQGALRVREGSIAELGDLTPQPGERTHSGQGCHLLPGFVQGHLHACQTLFRGLADDLPLLPWLRDRIWPLEHSHDAASAQLSAELTLAELLLGGTTAAQSMESVRFAEATAACAAALRMPWITGNCLMDQHDPQLPPGMAISAADNLARTDELRAAFHGKSSVRIAVSPRFVLSCTDQLARDAAAYAQQHDLAVHTHACEHRDEIAAVHARFGQSYLRTLQQQGLLTARTRLAHCVHLQPDESDLLRCCGAAVLHCPSTNLKLGSGIAPIAQYRAAAIPLALGADGAPCNNRLSMLTELRQAALLAALHAGPGALPAEAMLALATRDGARALQLQHELGQLRVGLRADCCLWDLRDVRLGMHDPQRPASALVYAASEANLREVYLAGERVVHNGVCLPFSLPQLHARVLHQLPPLLARAGLHR